jgi:hypothetical protein
VFAWIAFDIVGSSNGSKTSLAGIARIDRSRVQMSAFWRIPAGYGSNPQRPYAGPTGIGNQSSFSKCAAKALKPAIVEAPGKMREVFIRVKKPAILPSMPARNHSTPRCSGLAAAISARAFDPIRSASTLIERRWCMKDLRAALLIASDRFSSFPVRALKL